MVISSFKSVIQTCPFTGVKHPWKSSICVYISIEHIFQDMVNSCYVTWRVDLFWRWKRRHQTQRKKYSFSHCCRARECSTSVRFLYILKGKERCFVCPMHDSTFRYSTFSFDTMLVFQFHETGHQLDPHCRLMITNFHYVSLRGNWGWDDLNIDVHNGASGRRCRISIRWYRSYRCEILKYSCAMENDKW